MVMTSEKECDKAYRDYSEGFFGVPWDYRLNDDEWREVRDRQRQAREAEKEEQRGSEREREAERGQKKMK